MTSLHAFVHGTLQLSSSFLLSVVALSVVVTIAGLVMATARNVSAAGRHLLVSLSLFFPIIAGVVSSADLPALLRVLFPPRKDPPFMVVTVDTDLGSLAVAGPPSEMLCWLALVWAIGVVAYATASIGVWRRWSSIAREATEVTSEELRDVLRDVWNSARPLPRLALSSAATEPMVVGFVRPSILLPLRYVDRLSAEELRSVFAHETEHIRRRDNVTALLHELACALFWFDPTKWIARRRLLDLRERACDERVIELGCAPEPYLTALAKSCHAAIESPVVACMSGFHVRERMDSIMSYQSDRVSFVSNGFLRFLTAGATVVFALAFAVIAPLPAIAATEGKTDYKLDLQVRRSPDARITVTVNVFDPAGKLVMGAYAEGQEDQAMTLTTTADGREYRVTLIPDVEQPFDATLEVREDYRIVYTTTRRTVVNPMSSELAVDARPLSMRLQDANLPDVLRTFSELTGLEVVADPDIRGTVTIDLVDVPWDAALGQVAQKVGATVFREGDRVRLVQRKTSNVPEPPPGYLHIGGDVTAPVVIKRVAPIYPAEARAARITGIAIVRTLIDENGFVTDTQILKRLPMGLSEAAADAVKQWVFRPAMKDGVPVKVVFNLTVNFKLDDVAPNEGRIPSSASPQGENDRREPEVDSMPSAGPRAAAAPVASETATASDRMPMNRETAAPVLIKRVEPMYLEAARRERTEGRVVIRASIDAAGVVRDTEVVQSLPNGLSEEAERAVRQWVFRPGLVDGKPTASSHVVTVDFRRGA